MDWKKLLLAIITSLGLLVCLAITAVVAIPPVPFYVTVFVCFYCLVALMYRTI